MNQPTFARRTRRLAIALGAVAILTVVGAVPASAHDPIFVEEDQTTPDVGPYMPDGTISWALYGSVLEPGDTRGFEFDLREGDELYISLLIPNLEPELSLSDDDLPVIELEAPDGTTRTIVNDMREPFDEPFSSTSYLTLSELREPAQAGRYRGVVVGSAPARFTVAIGEREEFFTPAERTGDRPSSFPGIAAPLQAWYSTPPGEEASGELAEGDAEIQMELIEEAMEEGVGSAPEGALDESPTEDGAAADTAGFDDTGAENADTGDTDTEDTDTEDTDPADTANDDGGSLGWVAPAVAAIAVVLGAGWVLARRRTGSSESEQAEPEHVDA